MRRTVRVGKLNLGGKNPVRVQTMLKSRISEKKALKEFNLLARSGAEMIRVALPDLEEAEYLKKFTGRSVPVIADIHFDWRIALRAIELGVDKVRINPSNIGAAWKAEEVVKRAKEQGMAIRIGANIGSLKKAQFKDPEKRAAALLGEVEKELDILEKYRFRDLVVSFKADDIETTYAANKLFSEKYDYPLHIGLTATGDRQSGIVKSSMLLALLLREGIGSTLRVSLTSSALEEVETGWKILFGLGLRKPNYEIISCPTCGRCRYDLKKQVDMIKRILGRKKENISGRTIRIAVMGCEVNGPGEAASADFGFVAGKGAWALFEKGHIRKISAGKIETIVRERIRGQ